MDLFVSRKGAKAQRLFLGVFLSAFAPLRELGFVEQNKGDLSV